MLKKLELETITECFLMPNSQGNNRQSETAKLRESMGEAADWECSKQHSSSLAKVPRVEWLHKADFLVVLFKCCYPHKPPSKIRKQCLNLLNLSLSQIWKEDSSRQTEINEMLELENLCSFFVCCGCFFVGLGFFWGGGGGCVGCFFFFT